MAVSTEHQRSGVGAALIRFGLAALARSGDMVAVACGDPAFYGNAGFIPLSESVLKAPLDLSMPEGWLGESLTEKPFPARAERPGRIDAFRDPA